MYKKIKDKMKITNERIIKISKEFDKTPKIVEIIFYIIYIVLFLVLSHYHEPWNDEVQSFMIAKDATYKEMIFRLGHGEAHPALWWIMLSIFAKNGVNMMISLKLTSLIVNCISVYVILFKLRTVKIFKIIIPFTYFFFYQYGVISRCYCLLILGFSLLALFWNKKEEKPLKTVLSMLLICLSSAYGIALMLGMGIVWVIDILKDCKNNSYKSVFKKRVKEIKALILLSAIAFMISILLIPNKNTYALKSAEINATKIGKIIYNLVYMIFIEPIDALFFSSVYSDTRLSRYEITITVFVIGIVLSLIFWSVILHIPETYGRRREFIIPQTVFVLASTFTFFVSHHLGITTVFFFFWIYVCFEENNLKTKNECRKKYKETKVGKYMLEGEGKVLLPFEWMIFAMIIIVSLNWSINSLILDFSKAYVPDIAFIEKINSYAEREYKVYTTNQPTLAAYKTDNIIMYNDLLNGRKIDFTLLDPTEYEIDEKVKYWSEIGFPDVVTDFQYGIVESISMELGEKAPEYRMIEYVDAGKIFKGVQENGGYIIFMREDLADELGGLGLNKVNLKK